MRITNVQVKNYRNIDGINVVLNPDCNFIIGENNIGKSNFLSLLSTVCYGKAFEEMDFVDADKPIEIDMSIHISSHEIGYFRDNFSPDNASCIRIKYTQKIRDSYPSIICCDSGESISAHQMRKISFIRYDSTAIPSKELRLDTQKGTGGLIRTIIERFNEDNTDQYLNNELINNLINYINGFLNKMRGFRDYSIKATVASDPNEMLTSLLYLSDGSRRIELAGNGIQYMTMASISLLCKIMELYKSKSTSFESLLYIDDDGKKKLPIVLSVDEPEIHLHPFLQRSLIKYYKRVMNNEDNDFVDLLQSCFGIDGIDGQLIIVTHSTDALSGDYRNLIRFFRKENATHVISGYALRPVPGERNDHRIKTESEKHLIMHFPEIKEAFYAKCAILIEGITEYGCIDSFAEKMQVSLDDNGICVINAGGEKTIQPIRELLCFFGIPSVAIYDGDVKDPDNQDPNTFYTTEKCFEPDVVKTLYAAGKMDVVRRIVSIMDDKADQVVLNADFVKKHFTKMGADISNYTPQRLCDVSDNNEEEFCNMFSAWFMAKKGILLGRVVGEIICEADIPSCYRSAIVKAQEVASNV